MPEGARLALIAATSDYRDERFPWLAAPVNDARALARVLGDPQLGSFDVTTVLNKPAHRLMEDIEAFCSDLAPEDTVLLYFSCHGLKDDRGNLYLIARNTTRDRLLSTGLADSFLRNVLGECRAGVQVLMLDCCFGGAFARELMGPKGDDEKVDVKETFGDIGKGRVILTASNAMQYAFEDGQTEVAQSVFTKTVVDGIRSGEADVDGDQWISVQDLYDFTYRRVMIPGSKQTPTLTNIGVEGPIFLAKSRVSAGQGSAPVRSSPLVADANRRQDLRPWVRIHDQGAENASAAMAVVTAMETYLARNQGQSVSLSARYIYQKAKRLAGTAADQDLGITMKLLIDVVEEFGTVPDATWPYQPGSWQLPKGKTMKSMDAAARKFRVRMSPTGRLSDVGLELERGRPILASFNVFESTWLSANTSTKGQIAAPNPSDVLQGVVAVVIVDYDAQANILRFAHTWGAEWGDRGFGWMTVDAAKKMFNADKMWALEVTTETDGEGFDWGTAPNAPAAPPSPPLPSQRSRRSPSRRTAKPASIPRDRSPRRRVTAASADRGLARFVYDGRRMGGSTTAVSDKALARSEGDPKTRDKAVDRTYDAMGVVHRFLHEKLGRDSWDGKGAPYRAVVHYGRDFANGFWDANENVVMLGDGDGKLVNGFYDLDLVAKQFGNGLVQQATGLQYSGQSGALHNSLSLVIASMVKQYAAGETAQQADWLIGTGLLGPGVQGRGLVSLLDPGSAYDDPKLGRDPSVARMSDFVKTTEDGGGIHINFGIPSRAFALTARALGGYSWERAGAVWYSAMRSKDLARSSSFAAFARLTIEGAARDSDADVAAAVTDAWHQVGVSPRKSPSRTRAKPSRSRGSKSQSATDR